jgi:hypothetical protein
VVKSAGDGADIYHGGDEFSRRVVPQVMQMRVDTGSFRHSAISLGD